MIDQFLLAKIMIREKAFVALWVIADESSYVLMLGHMSDEPFFVDEYFLASGSF
jgi:hypothetical protein